MESQNDSKPAINAQELSQILLSLHSTLERQAQDIDNLKQLSQEKDLRIQTVFLHFNIYLLF